MKKPIEEKVMEEMISLIAEFKNQKLPIVFNIRKNVYQKNITSEKLYRKRYMDAVADLAADEMGFTVEKKGDLLIYTPPANEVSGAGEGSDFDIDLEKSTDNPDSAKPDIPDLANDPSSFDIGDEAELSVDPKPDPSNG